MIVRRVESASALNTSPITSTIGKWLLACQCAATMTSRGTFLDRGQPMPSTSPPPRFNTRWSTPRSLSSCAESSMFCVDRPSRVQCRDNERVSGHERIERHDRTAVAMLAHPSARGCRRVSGEPSRLNGRIAAPGRQLRPRSPRFDRPDCRRDKESDWRSLRSLPLSVVRWSPTLGCAAWRRIALRRGLAGSGRRRERMLPAKPFGWV